MPSPRRTFQRFVSAQLEELQVRLVAEFDRIKEEDVVTADPGSQDVGLQSTNSTRVFAPKTEQEEVEFVPAHPWQNGVVHGAQSLGTHNAKSLANLKQVKMREGDILSVHERGKREWLKDDVLREPEKPEEPQDWEELDVQEGPLHVRVPTAELRATNLSEKAAEARPERRVDSGATGGTLRTNSHESSAGSAVSARQTEAVSEKPVGSVAEYVNSISWEESPTRSRFSTKSLSAAEAAVQKEPFAPNGVIFPNCMGYRCWSNFLSVLVLFSCFLTPFRFGFFESRMGPMDRVDAVLDAIFFIDIIITFNVAVVAKDGLVTARGSIFLEYIFSFKFFVDLTATVPWDHIWVYFADSEASQEIAPALGLLGLLRVYRLLILFRKLQENTNFNLLITAVAKFVVFILLITHTSGCIFYRLAYYGAFSENTWVGKVDPTLPDRPLATRYMHVLFWAVGAFKAGPSSGALSPTSNTEMLLAVFTMMANICLGTYLVSNMSALLTAADFNIYNMRHQLVHVRDFATRYKLPRELRRQLKQFVKFKFSTHDEVDQTLLSGLPDLYRQRINHVLFDSLVKSVDIFRSCAGIFLGQLHSSFKVGLYMPDQQLATVDCPSNSLQIVVEGEMDLLHRGGIVMDVCHPGESFTAVSFICKVGQPYTVRTRIVCRVLSLSSSAWEGACAAFPENLQQVRYNLLLHCELKLKDFPPSSPGYVIYTELIEVVKAHLVQQEELAIAMLCSAAAHGDLPELKRQLVASTPNCCNDDNRMPLHLAAAHGRLEACRLLLDATAQVDPVDNFGRTPLLEACRAQQEAVAHLLFRRGATLKAGGQSGSAAELCQAASDVEQFTYIQALLRYGADPNVGDYDARTPLHLANASGNKAAVELLLAHPSINLNPYDNFGRTPLMEAVRHGHEACARLMNSRGATHGFVTDLREMADPNGVPAGQELCQAAFSNQVAYLNGLLNYCGINVDAADYDLRTALMLASAEGNVPVAVSLVQKKADIHRKDRWGHTAISEAEEHGHKELANVLTLMAQMRDVN